MDLRTSLILLALAASCGGNAHEKRSLNGQGGDATSTAGQAAGGRGGMPGAAGADDAAGSAGAAGSPGFAGAGGVEDVENAAGAGGMGGAAGFAGGSAECTSHGDCAASAECRSTSCSDGQCVSADAPFGTPISEQEAGDCLRTVCNGGGETMIVSDPSDVPT